MKVFITGGTSGIGLALAQRYHIQGHEVGACGRDIGKVKSSPETEGIKFYPLDVTDRKALQQAVASFSGGELDLMIIAAGTYTESVIGHPVYEESCAMLEVNILGTLNAMEVARELMHKQGKGHIAAIASVSGLLCYPQASIYAQSKRTVIQLCNAYRRALKDFGIQVTMIAPGYVDTPRLRELNNNDLSAKPFTVSCEYAAETIIEGISSGKQEIIFPTRMRWLIQGLSLLPDALLNLIMRKKATWKKKA